MNAPSLQDSQATDRGSGFAARLAAWRAGGAGAPALLMGILNITPDSFSDAGRNADPETAVAHGKAMAASGAAILDIGGESTRPKAQPVAADVELGRVLPVLQGLAGVSALLSIDTMKGAVADAACSAGAHVINDIRGLQGDPAIAAAAARHRAGVIAMHNPGLLGSSSGTGGDPIEACLAFFERTVAIAKEAGIAGDRLVLDPGFGFGKSLDQSLALLARLPELHVLGYPLLVGVSRKSFIGRLLGREPEDRLIGTLAAHVAAALAGAAILRVHDVEPHVDAIQMAAAIRGAARPSRPTGP